MTAIKAVTDREERLRRAWMEDEQSSDAYVQNYAEITVPSYTGQQFKNHFRMFPNVFEALCLWLKPHMESERTLTVEKKLLATLWVIANKEAYRSIADRFGLNKGTLHRIVMNVCHILTSLRGNVIKWPARHELHRLAERWRSRASFPGVIGSIDGTYIKITGTRGEKRDAYICRKGFPAMHLQVVCNKDLLFLDVYTGHAGSVHDCRVFRNSDLCTLLESPEGQLPREYHLLEDSTYPLKDYLLVPFRDNGHLSVIETAFNKAHSQTRVEVERAIGLLKGKFRRLKDLDMTNAMEIPYVIFAACVLHNFIILQNGVDSDDVDISHTDEAEAESHVQNTQNQDSAADKRLSIAHMLA